MSPNSYSLNLALLMDKWIKILRCNKTMARGWKRFRDCGVFYDLNFVLKGGIDDDKRFFSV